MKTYLTVTGSEPRTMNEMFERMFTNPPSLLEDFDLEEAEHGYLLSMDLPGMKKEDLKIEVSGRVLTLSGERKDRGSLGQGVRKFERSFSLPESVDAEKIEANLEDGVLRVALPKVEAAKARSIEVKVGYNGLFSKLIGSRSTERNH